MKSVIKLLTILMLFGSSSALPAQDSKQREKEKKKYWSAAVKQSKSIKHDKVRGIYPESGWLSGLWCRQGKTDATRFVEVTAENEIAVITKGFTATAKKVIFKPKSFLFQAGVDFFGKPVTVGNESHYDLWYAPKGTGATSTRYIFVERIRKISDTSFEVVYRGNYTLRDPKIRFEDFYKEESPKIAASSHWKKPQIYVKCD